MGNDQCARFQPRKHRPDAITLRTEFYNSHFVLVVSQRNKDMVVPVFTNNRSGRDHGDLHRLSGDQQGSQHPGFNHSVLIGQDSARRDSSSLVAHQLTHIDQLPFEFLMGQGRNLDLHGLANSKQRGFLFRNLSGDPDFRQVGNRKECV